MLDETASIEGRKAYLEQRQNTDLNSGLSSPQSELQPVKSPVKQSKDQTMIELSWNKNLRQSNAMSSMPQSSSVKTPAASDPDQKEKNDKRCKEEVESVIAEVETLQE